MSEPRKYCITCNKRCIISQMRSIDMKAKGNHEYMFKESKTFYICMTCESNIIIRFGNNSYVSSDEMILKRNNGNYTQKRK